MCITHGTFVPKSVPLAGHFCGILYHIQDKLGEKECLPKGDMTIFYIEKQGKEYLPLLFTSQPISISFSFVFYILFNVPQAYLCPDMLKISDASDI